MQITFIFQQKTQKYVKSPPFNLYIVIMSFAHWVGIVAFFLFKKQTAKGLSFRCYN